MPNQTPNLNLTKPLQTEYYNIDVHNANSDIIDTAIGNINTDKSDKLTAGNAIVLTKDTVTKTVNVAVDPNLVSDHNTDANAHSGILAKLSGAIFTGDVSVLTPAAADNTQKPANTSWIRSQMQSLVAGCIGTVAAAGGFEVSAQTNGYIKFPSWLGGIIIQWGFDASSDTISTIIFTKQFSSKIFCINSTPIISSTGATNNLLITSYDLQKFTLYKNATSAFWMSIGI